MPSASSRPKVRTDDSSDLPRQPKRPPNLVERVELALAKHYTVRAQAKEAIREVIAAMWEPSDKMRRAGEERAALSDHPSPGAVWDAMVAAFCEEERVKW